MDINLFNLRKMFQPDQIVGSDMGTLSNGPSNPMVNTMTEPSLNDLYKPEHQATDQFNTLLSQYPTEQNPSIMRKIGAALLNLGGQDGMKFLDEPNTKRIEDWKNKINPSLNAANLERNNNINERQMAQSTLNNRINQQKADTTRDQGQQKIDISKEHDEVYRKVQQFKLDHPDWQVKAVKGGNYTFFNPQDPTAKPVDTGIKDGELSDIEQTNLNQKNALNRIEKQGEVSQQKGWAIGTIPDPKDLTKQIGVRYNADTGVVEPINMAGQNTIIDRSSSPKQSPNLQAIQQKAQETLDALDEIFDDKGKLKPEIKTAVGKSRIFQLQRFPGTEAASADAKMKRVKDLLTLDLIQQMKNESKTGTTGFGSLNIKELGVLEGGASKFDPSLEEGTIESEGKRIREKLKLILQPQNGYDTTKTTSPIKLTPTDLIKKYGGK